MAEKGSPKSQDSISKYFQPTSPSSPTGKRKADQDGIGSPASKRSSRSRSRGEAASKSSPTDPPSQAKSKGQNPASKESGVVNRLTDTLEPGLIVMFVGVNPGIQTARTGNPYAHPTNHYWRLLHDSGLTAELHPPSDARRLPGLYKYGNTNLVSRATKDASSLKKDEMEEGVATLEEKVREFQPQAVCLVGKGIWEAVDRAWRKRGISSGPFKYGWQKHRIGGPAKPKGTLSFGPKKEAPEDDEAFKGAWLFVATTTSGLAASMSYEQKLNIWKELGTWAEGKRAVAEPEEKEEVATED